MDSPPSPIRLPASLEESRIHALPAAAYYIADFISEEEEQAILHKVARPRCIPGTPRTSLTETLQRLKPLPRQDGDNSRTVACRPGPRILLKTLYSMLDRCPPG
jgi:hypothetical protein